MKTTPLFAAFALLFCTATAHAQVPPIDIEIDPVAYAAQGHSLHAGVWLDQVRLDLGNFALKLPQWAHGQEGFEARAQGWGLKADWVFGQDHAGPFLGVEASVLGMSVTRTESARTDFFTQVNAGARAGWRVPLGAGFYAVPWLGLGWGIGAKEFDREGARWAPPGLQVFPALHIAYQVR